MSTTWSWSLSWLRWVGVAGLLAGLLVASRSFPTRPSHDWSSIQSFELNSQECEALRESRGTTQWLAPSSFAAQVNVTEVAEKFRIERALVCQANQLPDATCSGKTLRPGEDRLMLPLYRESPPSSRRTP
jgi:hypothetical protein